MSIITDFLVKFLAGGVTGALSPVLVKFLWAKIKAKYFSPKVITSTVPAPVANTASK